MLFTYKNVFWLLQAYSDALKKELLEKPPQRGAILGWVSKLFAEFYRN